MTLGAPMRKLLESALEDFEKALVSQKVYDAGHPNLRRAYLGAEDFVKYLVDGPGRVEAATAEEMMMNKPQSPRPTTAAERFVAATRQVLSVSKAELEKREKTWRETKRTRKRRS